MIEQIQDVNIELGDDTSRMFYEASKLTYDNRPGYVVEMHESFSGFRAIPGVVLDKDIRNLFFNIGFDGIGTKVEVAERLNDHSGSGYDLLAMVCDDAVVRGAEPLAVGSILDVKQLDDTELVRSGIRELCVGMVGAAAAARVVVINGEVAELGARIDGYGDFNYNWGGAVFWAAHKDRLLTGHQIKPGDTLIGLPESGFRSNGITDVRKAMLEHYGEDWHHQVAHELGTLSLGRLVQQPSTIYAGFVSELTGGFDIEKEPKAKLTGVAHITGGGQPSKLARMLEPSGLGVTIDRPLDPPAIMLHVQKLRQFSDRKSYGKWHMGPAMILTTPEPAKVMAEGLRKGIALEPIGQVTEEPGIRIKNRGAEQNEEWLFF